ncbi:MAG: MerR family transcriptional regulator [Dehalococcoidales bacterium]|nr:MerR family transcriptional regulator [Dehalococcoidales bacterium]
MVHEILLGNIRITQFSRVTGASVDELHYMEKKGFIRPNRTRLKRREVRQYPKEQVQQVKLILKYRREGFTWDAAFEKARGELQKPTLFGNA